RTFNVTVSPLNDPPTLNSITDLTINENAGTQIVGLSGITAGPPNEIQSLTVTAISSDPTLIPNPAVAYVSPNAAGTLSFVPVANATGSVSITVTVSDGQSSASRSFAVTVQPSSSRPDNTPPSISAIANQSI